MEELSVLLVDDEPIDLEWLRRRVAAHPRLKEDKVFTATSGFAALKLMEQQKIDILLSDIRMPIMTGMEFARRAKELLPGLAVVFISGHQDFAYAREAIEMSAYGYLLKPVDDGELNAKLDELIVRILGELEQHRLLSDKLSLVHQELLLRWLRSDASGQTEPLIRDLLDPLLAGGATAAVIEIDDVSWRMKELVEEDRRERKRAMDRWLRDFSAGRRLGTLLPDHDCRFVLLSGLAKEQLPSRLQPLIDEFHGEFGYTLTIGIGMHASGLGQLQDSFRQALAALSIKWILGKNRIIEDASEWSPKTCMSPNLEDKVDQMLQAMLDYDLVVVDDCLQELFGGASPLASKSDLYDLIIRITSKLHADLLQMNENLYEILGWDQAHSSVLFQFETMQDIVSWLRRRFFELSELLYLKKQRQKRKLIDNITGYVEERLNGKVTLNEVAAHFNFTPNYLGQLFKQETGTLFSDYLIQLRMKRACELLLDPSLKIYEIAERIGYKNIIYFNRQFKETMQMSPGDYRKKHRV